MSDSKREECCLCTSMQVELFSAPFAKINAEITLNTKNKTHFNAALQSLLTVAFTFEVLKIDISGPWRRGWQKWEVGTARPRFQSKSHNLKSTRQFCIYHSLLQIFIKRRHYQRHVLSTYSLLSSGDKNGMLILRVVKKRSSIFGIPKLC